MTTRLPHYLEVLQDRREQVRQDLLTKQLQIQELDKEIAQIQAEDREFTARDRAIRAQDDRVAE